MLAYTLIVLHGPNIDLDVLPDLQGDNRQIIVMDSPEDRPWLGLARAGLEKIRRELSQPLRYTRCIGVTMTGYNLIEIGRLLAAPLREDNVVVPRLGTFPGVYEMQTADADLFCASGLAFNRIAEFQYSLDRNPPVIQAWPIPAQFYHHLKSVGLIVDVLP